MESQRNLLLLALVFVSFLLYKAWIDEKNPEVQPQVQTSTVTQQATTDVPPSSNFSADVPVSAYADAPDQVPTQTADNKTVALENDQLRLAISLKGGDVVSGKAQRRKFGQAVECVGVEGGDVVSGKVQTQKLGKAVEGIVIEGGDVVSGKV